MPPTRVNVRFHWNMNRELEPRFWRALGLEIQTISRAEFRDVLRLLAGVYFPMLEERIRQGNGTDDVFLGTRCSEFRLKVLEAVAMDVSPHSIWERVSSRIHPVQLGYHAYDLVRFYRMTDPVWRHSTRHWQAHVERQRPWTLGGAPIGGPKNAGVVTPSSPAASPAVLPAASPAASPAVSPAVSPAASPVASPVAPPPAPFPALSPAASFTSATPETSLAETPVMEPTNISANEGTPVGPFSPGANGTAYPDEYDEPHGPIPLSGIPECAHEDAEITAANALLTPALSESSPKSSRHGSTSECDSKSGKGSPVSTPKKRRVSSVRPGTMQGRVSKNNSRQSSRSKSLARSIVEVPAEPVGLNVSIPMDTSSDENGDDDNIPEKKVENKAEKKAWTAKMRGYLAGFGSKN
ncbi:hypothetical protein N7535_003607 [Penicillium sp. DV-2018c]|nr:hypothetical protein N7461_000692 [Penicillium sp. DV-2018c]KAJ5576681.1 hypothetical protein N7535_003607 [Penicillium sp. DV-2018c]